MFKTTTLRTRFMVSFVCMGLIVLMVSLVGWSANDRLTGHINTLNKNALPSATGLWKINEGQTQIQSAERRLFDPRLSADEREEVLSQVKNAWAQIDAGFKEYEATPTNNEAEEKQYQKFKPSWEAWKQAHQRFMELEEKFSQQNIRNPWEKRAELLSQGKKENSPEMATVKGAMALYEQMDIQQTKREEPLFEVAHEEAWVLLKLNDELADETQKKVEKDVTQTKLWAILGMAIGPVTAIIFGIYFTNTIAKPLETQVQKSGIKITSSTTQIAASGKQLEAMMTEQVASTNEVVATAKEIAATSGQLVQTMDEVTEMAAATTTAAGSGQKDIQRMEATMQQLANATSSIAGKLGVISEKAHNINGVVITITKVADRTNLLSLNAAIEAEKAGEYGLGFAVVAREIRRLADQTAVATLDIEQIVKEMQSAVSTGVMEMDKFTKEVGRSVEDVRNLSGQLAEIISQVRALSPRFEEVNQGMESQSVGAQQISEAMVQLSEASSQTSESLREINGAIAQLNEAAQGLRREIIALN